MYQNIEKIKKNDYCYSCNNYILSDMFIFGSEIYEDEEIIVGESQNDIEENPDYDIYDKYMMMSIKFQNKCNIRTTVL